MIGAILADDLTGASDSAMQFTRAGWKAALLLERRSARIEPEDDTLLAGTADNRAMPADAAREAAHAAVHDLQRLGADRLFVKIDSTMRGSAAAHIAGALSAWRTGVPDAVAVVCPAYPGMGRAVAADVVLVDGVPVAETPFRHDPVSPVVSSTLGELLPGSVPLARFGAPTVAEAVALAADRARSGGPLLFTADANSDADLQRLAEAIARHAGSVVPVGSAGLAAAVARTWRPADATDPSVPEDAPAGTGGRALVQITSLNEVSRRQAAALEQHYGGRGLRLTPDLRTLSDPGALERWFESRSAGHLDYDLVLLSAPADRGGDTRIGSLPAERLAALTARLLRTGQFGVAGFVGGDGARAALAQLGVSTLRILGSLEDGVPVSAPADGDAPGVVLFTKAGGFGDPETLVTALSRLTGFQARRSNA